MTSLYRTLMRGINRLPDGRKLEARTLARNEFRANGNASGQQLEAAVQKAEDSLKYVEMLTPKLKRKNAGRYVLGKDGELVLLDGNALSENGVQISVDRGITSEHLQRHHSLLRRQHFMDRK